MVGGGSVFCGLECCEHLTLGYFYCIALFLEKKLVTGVMCEVVRGKLNCYKKENCLKMLIWDELF